MPKKIKIIASVLLFLVFSVLFGKILRYALVDDTSSYTRVTFHEMYEQDNIDILFVGSSHCYRAFIPEVLDEELGANTFNVGTSSQLMDGSSMVIKEAARYNDIKHIFLEVYFDNATDVRKNRTQMTPTYLISDYIKPSVDKFWYLLNASNNEQYVNSFIIARRNWEKLYDFKYIRNLLQKKSSVAYKSYDYTYITGDTEWYAGKGYVASNGDLSNWNFYSTIGWDKIPVEKFSDDWYDSLTDIINFCDRKGIKLTLVGAPITDFYLAGSGNYDEYVSLLNEVIEDKNVDYFDFNLCKEEYFSNTPEFFKDLDHLNNDGAEKFSHSLAMLVNEEVAAEDMFYSSYDEKMADLTPGIFGISYQDDNNKRNCKIVSTGTTGMEYQVQIEPKEGDKYVVQEFSEKIYFEIPAGVRGNCKIYYRMKAEPGIVYTVDIAI